MQTILYGLPGGCNIPGEDADWDFGTGAGFYVDATTPHYDAHYRMFSYVTEELPRVIAANYSVTEKRGIMGHRWGRGRVRCTFRPYCYACTVCWGIMGHRWGRDYINNSCSVNYCLHIGPVNLTLIQLSSCHCVALLTPPSPRSMGGHGALVCALRKPGFYQSVSAFAPICHPSACPWGEGGDKVMLAYI